MRTDLQSPRCQSNIFMHAPQPKAFAAIAFAIRTTVAIRNVHDHATFLGQVRTGKPQIESTSHRTQRLTDRLPQRVRPSRSTTVAGACIAHRGRQVHAHPVNRTPRHHCECCYHAAQNSRRTSVLRPTSQQSQHDCVATSNRDDRRETAAHVAGRCQPWA